MSQDAKPTPPPISECVVIHRAKLNSFQQFMLDQFLERYRVKPLKEVRQ